MSAARSGNGSRLKTTARGWNGSGEDSAVSSTGAAMMDKGSARRMRDKTVDIAAGIADNVGWVGGVVVRDVRVKRRVRSTRGPARHAEASM